MYIADLHIHSRFSRATSRECDLPHLDLWAGYKGIRVVGTGDFTHPAWRQEMWEQLVPAEQGLYTLREELRLPASLSGIEAPRFVVTGEISTIYKKNGKTRKVHHLILLPGIDEAELLSQKLEAIGNLHSDGRPILGLDSRNLLEIILETCPDAVYIPAHIWTPHFSVFGAFSGFDTLEECFEDLTPYVHALETGLSSDPPMNWQVSALDRFTLVSHSDAHSPQKLGREADLLDTELSYPALAHAIQTGESFAGTLEFFPEEGKYHLDGHRNCGLCLTPAEAAKLENRCPVCGKKLTIGVQHRVEELADRALGYRPTGAKPFESLIPLPELIASVTGTSAAAKKTQEQYFSLLRELGPEFSILRELPLSQIEKAAGPLMAEGIRRMRAGEVRRVPGYDGEYGVISVFTPEERQDFLGQLSFFAAPGHILPKAVKKKPVPAPQAGTSSAKALAESNALATGLNPEQTQAVHSSAAVTAVIAGPGAGKTKTLVSRIAWMIQSGQAKPSEITAVTFTRQAAGELQARLEQELGGKKAIRGLTVGTFHAICQKLLDARPVLSQHEITLELKKLLLETGEKLSPKALQQAISRIKNGIPGADSQVDPELLSLWSRRMKEMGVRDLDDLLIEALTLDLKGKKSFTHLLVDEFQDINPVQHHLVEHWSHYAKSLFVIGDPDQSIYGFRGADAACFQRLLEQHPDACVIRLADNYRSSPAVLQAACELISHNSGEPRSMKANAPQNVPVRLMQLHSQTEESIWIAREIRRMTGGLDMLEAQSMGAPESSTRSFSEIAVLCRTHRQLEQLEKALIHDSIPCVISGRGSALEQDEVQGVLAFYRFLLHPDNLSSLTTALELVWNCPAHLRERAKAVFCNGVPSEETLREEFGSFGHLALWLEEWERERPRVAHEKPRKLLDGWRERHEESRTASSSTAASRAMEQLCQTAIFYSTMAELLEALEAGEEIDISRGQKKYPSGAVRLMTLHAAKGLEFPVVFVVGLEKGKLPLESADGSCDLEEERRLLFVGMTRAREELLLSCGGEPSVFEKELPASVLRQKGQRRPTVTQLSLF